MRRGERWVKRLDAECARVFVEPFGRHQRDGAEATNVAIVEVASVVEREVQCRVRRLALRQRAAPTAVVRR